MLWGLLWLFSPYMRALDLIEAPTTYWGVAGFAVASAIVSVLLAFAVIFVGRLILAPARLYWNEHERAERVNQRLVSIGQERPFAYDHADFNTTIHGKTIDVGATIYFMNHGNEILRWRLVDAYIEVNGHRNAFVSSQSYFVNKGQRAWFHYHPCKNAPFPKWPITVNVMFDVEYDNVPPLRVRGTKRVIRYVISATKQKNIPAVDVYSDER